MLHMLSKYYEHYYHNKQKLIHENGCESNKFTLSP